MDVRDSTRAYEAWLAGQIPLIAADVELKHKRMAADPFSFLRATFYRWTLRWPQVCSELAAAPTVLSVGDLHIENFGTWRDQEGRLVWGVNDFDEAFPLPYTNDLSRLAASAILAARASKLLISHDESCEAILAGYQQQLDGGGTPFILSEQHRRLRDMAEDKLRDPVAFWKKLDGFAAPADGVPGDVAAALEKRLPESGLSYKVVHRIAGLGSLGRRRFVALSDWRGGKIAREAKELALSACLWQREKTADREIHYGAILTRAVRSPDPWVQHDGCWLVRRLAPDCSRIEIADLPKEPDESRILRAMGAETANIHLGEKQQRAAILTDLGKRPAGWLRLAAEKMAAAVDEDFKAWR